MDWTGVVVAAVSGAAALVGAVIGNVLSTLSRKREAQLSARASWAELMIQQMRETFSEHESSGHIEPPVPALLLDHFGMSTMSRWAGRQRSEILRLCIEAENTSMQSTTSYEQANARSKAAMRTYRAARQLLAHTEKVIAQWAVGGKAWPSARLRLENDLASWRWRRSRATYPFG